MDGEQRPGYYDLFQDRRNNRGRAVLARWAGRVQARSSWSRGEVRWHRGGSPVRSARSAASTKTEPVPLPVRPYRALCRGGEEGGAGEVEAGGSRKAGLRGESPGGEPAAGQGQSGLAVSSLVRPDSVRTVVEEGAEVRPGCFKYPQDKRLALTGAGESASESPAGQAQDPAEHCTRRVTGGANGGVTPPLGPRVTSGIR